MYLVIFLLQVPMNKNTSSINPSLHYNSPKEHAKKNITSSKTFMVVFLLSLPTSQKRLNRASCISHCPHLYYILQWLENKEHANRQQHWLMTESVHVRGLSSDVCDCCKTFNHSCSIAVSVSSLVCKCIPKSPLCLGMWFARPPFSRADSQPYLYAAISLCTGICWWCL